MTAIDSQLDAARSRATDLKKQIASKTRQLDEQEKLIAALEPLASKPEPVKEAKK